MSRRQQEPPRVVGDNTLVGLPVFTSDGKEVGMAIALGTDESDEAVLVTQIERPLGFGTDLVAIPTDMFVRKADRIELTSRRGNSATRLPDRTKSNDAVPPIPALAVCAVDQTGADVVHTFSPS